MSVMAIQSVCDSKEIAEEIIATCLLEGIVASADLEDGVLTFSMVDGIPRQSKSVKVTFKTTGDLYPKVMSAITEMHPELEFRTCAYPIAVSRRVDHWVAEQCGSSHIPAAKSQKLSLAH
ncbi:divalent cation tolerance protein CutA [Roseibium sp. RKSG952]|uniref:divalent cation tolerance protein CutA n=1 Tax=Roseibium sp. RKSG952 TaxID=2529384 RepID=UPI0018AD1953|nr:divalent cation tolerance protein CutA [Roseibium sp. RKSG952]